MINISENLAQINKSFNLRFEKDTTLYISKDDEETIKKILFNRKYQNLQAIVKKLGNKVVVKVLLKNSWLIDFAKLNSENKKIISNVFAQTDREFLINISKDIREDNIYSSLEFKNFIKQFTINSTNSLKTYKNIDENINVRAIAFGIYIKTEYRLKNSIENSLRFIDQEFNNYQELYNNINQYKNNMLDAIFINAQDYEKETVANWIIENKLSDKKDKVWTNGLRALGDYAFDAMIKYVQENPEYDNTTTKLIIQKRLGIFYKSDNFKEKIVSLYKDSYKIRILFFHLLEPDKFRDKELAQNIVSNFKAIGVPNSAKALIVEIEKWEVESVQNSFPDRKSFIQNLNEGNQDLTNRKTLNHFQHKLKKTDEDVILDIYFNQRETEVQTVLAFYLAESLRFKRVNSKLKCIVEDNEYIELIADLIDKEQINTKYSKEFLFQNNKDEILIKLNRR